MTPDVYITGIGLATPLGLTPEQGWRGLLESRYIEDHASVPQLPDGPGLRVDRLARLVASQALSDAAWGREKTASAALVLGTSRGPVEGWIPDVSANHAPVICEYAQTSTAAAWGMSSVAANVARQFGFESGPRLTFSSACASALHALIRAALLLKNGEAERALVIGADSSLHPMFLQSFRRLGVFPPSGFGCRPFDENRAGFLASEAAAAVCLETAGNCRDSKRWARIDRFALAADAYHLTGSDPAATTLTRILHHVTGARPIDLIHAHGTATGTNDPIELAAFDALMSSNHSPPHVYSHKGALGHSLGAAGLVSVVLNCMSHHHGLIPPNVRTHTPIPTRHLRIDRHAVARPIARSIVSAAGFGGAIAAIALD